NNTRLTVPSGVSRVRVTAGVQTPSSTGALRVQIYKNGTEFRGMGEAVSDTAGADGVIVTTGVIPVTAGDYFEVLVTDTAALTLAGNTQWASIEEVPAARSAAALYLSTNQIVPAGTETPV